MWCVNESVSTLIWREFVGTFMKDRCPGCGELFHLDDQTTRVWEYRCPHCHTTEIVPAPSA